jgi:hypothetical protein
MHCVKSTKDHWIGHEKQDRNVATCIVRKTRIPLVELMALCQERLVNMSPWHDAIGHAIGCCPGWITDMWK